MSIFGFLKKTVELPLNIASDVIKVPKAIIGEDVDFTSTRKLREIFEEMEE